MSELEPSKSSREEASGRIRQRNQAIILAAAVDEFVSRGFEGASMKRVAERAELPRANIHYYYKNKLDLYSALLGDIIEVWNTRFASITAEDEPRAALGAYIRAKVEYSRSHPAASRIFASEIIHGAPRLKTYLEGDFQHWVKHKTAVIQSWIDQGKMDPIDPLHLLFFIWGSTQHYADFGVQVLAAMDRDALTDQDLDHIVDTLTQLVCKGCGIGD